jgi:UDP-3-O-[3-hydroxymyristoyl] glucosamine N-acyltransferase
MSRIHPGADVDETARIGEDTTIWHLAQIREDASLGRECIIGRGAYVGPGVRIGDRVKLQNYALVYEPAVIEDGVFIGPAAVLTNDTYPRSVDTDGRLKRADDWAAHGVVVREGAAIGARAVIVAGRTPALSSSPAVRSAGGRWWPPARWSPGTWPTSRWSRACPPAGSAGSGVPVSR